MRVKLKKSAFIAALISTSAMVPTALADQSQSNQIVSVQVEKTAQASNLVIAATQLSSRAAGPVASDQADQIQRPAAQIIVHDSLKRNLDASTIADLALDKADIRMTFDSLEVTPHLNIGLIDGRVAGIPGEPLKFDTHWNYSAWVNRAEVRIFDADDELIKAPIAVVAVDLQTGEANWTIPATRNTSRYTYVLRVYNADGKFDETIDKWIRVVSESEAPKSSANAYSAIDGLDATATRNIQVRGGAVTVSGLKMAGDGASNIKFMGRPIQMDRDGDFVVREIVPAGQHSIDVSYTREDGKQVDVSRSIEIPENDFFMVAIGDLTVGTRTSESRALLEASGEDFDETYVTGRGAFYLKGKIQGKYLLTASMDTTEDDVDNLFSNLSDKDPQSLLRRLDPDRYYPVYGDDSTYVEDAPTQGRFYVRLERGDDHIVWGNFLTNVTNTEFAQIDRGLYGAKAQYNSDETTSNGERTQRVTIFAADPGTVPAREEFQATGGSVYFLERQDLTIGSERLRVEIRDQDSGLVLETRDLQPFVDYDIDYIQGRILLSAPLTSTALGTQIVRDGTVSGNSVYLVARYEHTPGLDEIDGFTTGGRVERWVNDSIRLGLTAQGEETGDADQTLVSADIIARMTDQTYVKAELAQTDGAGFQERASIDGGFSFNPLIAGTSNDATAWRVEGAATLSDLAGVESDTKLTGYYEQLEAGFSGVGRLTLGETERFGASLTRSLGDQGSLAFKFDDVSIDGGVDEVTAAADFRFGLSDTLTAGLGLRYNDIAGSAFGNDGERTDLGVELRHQANASFVVYGFAQGTLSASGLRADANRAGLGIETSLTEQLQARGEVSGGDGGTGALAELTWQRQDGEEYYLNYTLDAERQEPGVDGTSFLSNSQNGLTAGARKRFNDVVSVYGEERASFGDTTGVTHAYGIDFIPAERWSLGASFQVGDLEDAFQRIEREVYTATAGYAGETVNFGTAFEWREDEDPIAVTKRETWLFRSNASVKVSPDWRALLKFNKAESNSNAGAFFAGDFTELQLAGAYRPVENDRLNALLRYTYFEDLPTSAQISSSGQTGIPAQKSNILSVDANYRISNWLTFGGKYGLREGQVSLSRTDADFVTSKAQLAVARVDFHVVKKWDGLLEARILDVDLAQDTKAGFLAAIYRHVGDNAKVGIGYNFTDFSDDLTDLSYNDDGLFLNIIAKF